MAKETLILKLARFLTVYLFVVPSFILMKPFAKLYDFFRLSNFRGLRNDPPNHARKVKDIQDQVYAWNRTGKNEGKFMCSARPAWQKIGLHSYSKKNLTPIKLDLNEIIEIDVLNQVVWVEPGIKMKRLTSILVPKGWTIPVLPEFDTLTVGGVICGAGLETSSHKYGMFHLTCTAFEVVLSDGNVVTCSREANSDLFYAIPHSHGTIGFLTAVKFPLKPATKFIRLEYFPLKSQEQVMTMMQDARQDFVEGIVYGPNETVVTFGNSVKDSDVDPGKINRINRWYKPWFYKHVESFLHKQTYPGEPFEEYITLTDYYHRHTRGYFWEAKVFLPYGNTPLFRFLCGWIYPLNFQLCKLLAPKYLWDMFFVHNHVLQDFLQPIDTLPTTLKFIHDLVEVYPIWLCGIAAPPDEIDKPWMLNPKRFYLDIGIYGDTPKKKQFHPVETSRQIEKYSLANQGFQGLYADSYLTREEFKQMFYTELYDKVRVKYNCVDAFPDVYDKVCHHSRK